MAQSAALLHNDGCMPHVKPVDPTREIELALRVPYFGKEANDLIDALPQLEAYLKHRYPGVDNVGFRYRNPGPAASVQSFLYVHEAWILIALLNPFTQKIMSNVADDAYKWLKKKFRVKRGHGKSQTRNQASYRWVISTATARRADKSQRAPVNYLLLSLPAHKLPVFTTREKAVDFLNALRPIINRSLPIGLRVQKIQWHAIRDEQGNVKGSRFARKFGLLTDPNDVVFDPLFDDAKKAVLVESKPPRIIRLVAKRALPEETTGV